MCSGRGCCKGRGLVRTFFWLCEVGCLGCCFDLFWSGVVEVGDVGRCRWRVELRLDFGGEEGFRG